MRPPFLWSLSVIPILQAVSLLSSQPCGSMLLFMLGWRIRQAAAGSCSGHQCTSFGGQLSHVMPKGKTFVIACHGKLGGRGCTLDETCISSISKGRIGPLSGMPANPAHGPFKQVLTHMGTSMPQQGTRPCVPPKGLPCSSACSASSSMRRNPGDACGGGCTRHTRLSSACARSAFAGVLVSKKPNACPD